MAPALTFRRAAPGDVAAIVTLLADDVLGAGREELGSPLHPGYIAGFAAIEADPNQLLVIVEDDGAIVGTMQLGFIPGLSRRGAWHCQIEAVRVAAPLRGGGIGAAMMAWALDEARRRGCALAQLSSHKDRTAAHRFYERLGFVRSHAGFKLAI